MGFSPLANMKRRIPHSGRQSNRLSKVTGVGIHHNAGINAYGEATRPGREVSANYWITNDGDILPNVDESMRAWTSGHIAYPAGAQADHRNITIEVSNSATGGDWPISAKAMDALIRLIADIYQRHGLGTVKRGASKGVGVHSDWVATACPGPYIMGKLGHIISEAEKLRKGGKSAPSPAPKPSGKKSVATLAAEVYRGDWGNGDERRRRLEAAGYNYAQVQAEVDRKYYGAAPSKPAPKPAGKTIAALAKEVWDGKWGNDPQRSQKLRAAGHDPVAVQNEVNRRYYGASAARPAAKPAGKSLATLAAEVYRGDWGNDPERTRRLTAAGYNAQAVQAEVNRRYYS